MNKEEDFSFNIFPDENEIIFNVVPDENDFIFTLSKECSGTGDTFICSEVAPLNYQWISDGGNNCGGDCTPPLLCLPQGISDPPCNVSSWGDTAVGTCECD